MTDVSVIGCGNMGSALIQGLAASGKHTLTACDLDPDALAAVEAYSSQTTDDPTVATEAAVVVVAVKPAVVEAVLKSIDLSEDQTLVSFAAGVSTEFVEQYTDATVVRVMPNLAAETRTMAAAVTEHSVTDEVRELLDDVGEFVEIDEDRMDVATAVNGSGPAFVYYLLDAMAQAGVDRGLEPEQARLLAAQTFKGAAETVLRTDRPIDEMIDAVCSPNGTTIEGMDVLWESEADEAVTEAVTAAAERSAELAVEAENE
ncbi:pyrroline-5-carboxylate reductase [Natronobacterium gregoryi]|uniref:Pyrroline-5-carboxylate reductase n=2 Tax=Natronobacterium gregoryi TaxID=44930 RepID=L0AKF6_NATGS|nr:pyrroline-5-carboxylate reductase [Natronobacterium gregoryi]AFZ73632.1 pyrroline-5-carboxylate reductase [Natronobacterium gregoryi SP2]ELY67915.1 pyrroline-5-carboxylate reductase [Natronobacterium gregoryi SP2]PLK19979.1 pyrroline-5-carboxylate reductase [Natronobacterium gregoryi SP2]SFJ33958.1 pyrroline-5-carboxylate reductase [Natronobacterium gregoryi]